MNNYWSSYNNNLNNTTVDNLSYWSTYQPYNYQTFGVNKNSNKRKENKTKLFLKLKKDNELYKSILEDYENENEDVRQQLSYANKKNLEYKQDIDKLNDTINKLKTKNKLLIDIMNEE